MGIAPIISGPYWRYFHPNARALGYPFAVGSSLEPESHGATTFIQIRCVSRTVNYPSHLFSATTRFKELPLLSLDPRFRSKKKVSGPVQVCLSPFRGGEPRAHPTTLRSQQATPVFRSRLREHDRRLRSIILPQRPRFCFRDGETALMAAHGTGELDVGNQRREDDLRTHAEHGFALAAFCEIVQNKKREGWVITPSLPYSVFGLLCVWAAFRLSFRTSYFVGRSGIHS